MGDQTFLTVLRGDKKVDARAILGLTHREPEITGVDRALTAGRWFIASDTFAIILPKEIADVLGVTDVSVDAGTARVRYAGNDYRVVGLIDNDTFKAIKDLDQEPLTPVDFILMQRQSGAGGAASARADSGSDAGFLQPMRHSATTSHHFMTRSPGVTSSAGASTPIARGARECAPRCPR